MPTRLPQPLLVAALALPLLMLLQDQAGHLFTSLLPWGLLLGVGWLFFPGWNRRATLSAPPSTPPSPEKVKQTLAATTKVLQQLEAEMPAAGLGEPLRQKVDQIDGELSRQEFHLAIMGAKGVGKTSLIHLLQTQWLPQCARPCTLLELPATALANPPLADLIVFVVQGDITESEYAGLTALHTAQQRTLVVWNKQDQYLPTEQPLIWQQLVSRLKDRFPIADLLAIATAPQPLQVQRHQADGSVQTWLEHPAPQITPLLDRLGQVLAQEGEHLILQQTLSQAIRLESEVRATLNQNRRERALPIIERYQWLAAATTFANPIPSLDLLAATVITARLVMDLAKVYQQEFSLRQAQAIATVLGSLLLKLGLVEFSTQTIAGWLKSNSLTFVAGGAVQGISAAYLTHLAGLSLIEYFQSHDPASPDRVEFPNTAQLQRILTRLFQEHQRLDFLKTLFQQGLVRLRGTEWAGTGRS